MNRDQGLRTAPGPRDIKTSSPSLITVCWKTLSCGWEKAISSLTLAFFGASNVQVWLFPRAGFCCPCFKGAGHRLCAHLCVRWGGGIIHRMMTPDHIKRRVPPKERKLGWEKVHKQGCSFMSGPWFYHLLVQWPHLLWPLCSPQQASLSSLTSALDFYGWSNQISRPLQNIYRYENDFEGEFKEDHSYLEFGGTQEPLVRIMSMFPWVWFGWNSNRHKIFCMK